MIKFGYINDKFPFQRFEVSIKNDSTLSAKEISANYNRVFEAIEILNSVENEKDFIEYCVCYEVFNDDYGFDFLDYVKSVGTSVFVFAGTLEDFAKSRIEESHIPLDCVDLQKYVTYLKGDSCVKEGLALNWITYRGKPYVIIQRNFW